MRAQVRRSILLALAPLATAVAQTETGDLRAFAALRSSHIGSLTPLLTPAMESRRLSGVQLAIRYGLRRENGVMYNGYAGTALFNAGMQSSVSLTAGVLDAYCDSCPPALMLGAGGDMRIAELADAFGTGSQFTVAVSGEFGYAQLKPGSDNANTLTVGLPLTLSIGSGGKEGMRIAPYFTPVFGVGQTSTPCMNTASTCDKSGMRWVMGGGIGVWNPTSNVSASIGANQVLLSGAKPVFGVNVMLGGR